MVVFSTNNGSTLVFEVWIIANTKHSLISWSIIHRGPANINPIFNIFQLSCVRFSWKIGSGNAQQFTPSTKTFHYGPCNVHCLVQRVGVWNGCVICNNKCKLASYMVCNGYVVLSGKNTNLMSSQWRPCCVVAVCKIPNYMGQLGLTWTAKFSVKWNGKVCKNEQVVTSCIRLALSVSEIYSKQISRSHWSKIREYWSNQQKGKHLNLELESLPHNYGLLNRGAKKSA